MHSFQNTSEYSSYYGSSEEITVPKSKILIFEQRKIGNIDNSTKIVSSIVGHNIVKIAEEFVEEIDLSPVSAIRRTGGRYNLQWYKWFTM